MTEKLYYSDAYISKFTATVLECTECDGRFSILLDKTAFFPEEGGQSADTGRIGGSVVRGAYERDRKIYHLADAPLCVGATVECELDFATRLDKMRQHTAEHIISGIVHSLHGYGNVGFHLGDDIVTCDFDGAFTDTELERIELLANRAVMDDLPVTAYFPSSDELASLEYRSKLELSENVRIVIIEGIDSCACCAPHVARTGEIGCIKILDCIRWRGGVRMTIAAGERAVADYVKRHNSCKSISALLSSPRDEVESAVINLKASLDKESARVRELLFRIAAIEADKLSQTEKNRVVALPDLTVPSLIEFTNLAIGKVGGILVALIGSEGDYKYVVRSESRDLKQIARDMNIVLRGKGGGNSGMLQGSFSAGIDEIRSFFEEL